MQKDGSLKLRHSWTASIVQACVSPHLAMMRNKPGGEDRNAISLCVVSVIVDDRVIGIAVVDVKRSTIHARAVTQECFILFHNAIATHPCPDCIWSSHALRCLHSGIPRDIRSDSAIPHPEEDNSVSLHVMHDGVANNNVRAPGALRRPSKISTAYHDAHPFLRVVGGYAIHQHIVEALIDTTGRDHD